MAHSHVRRHIAELCRAKVGDGDAILSPDAKEQRAVARLDGIYWQLELEKSAEGRGT